MNKKVWLVCLIVIVGITLAGCFKTYTYQAERNDQSLAGNRGVIVGKPPAETRRSAPTRTMMGADIELQTTSEMVKSLKSKKTKKTVGVGEATTKLETEEYTLEGAEAGPPTQEFETYLVKKNDTLQKISKDFYGTTKNWKKIFNANKDVLKSPDKIRPGQKIKIPKLGKVKESASLTSKEKGIK